ncbi:segregation/condensation protein A [Mycoplasma iguanae]|uniref:Segregation and condensation protein A n=1 Tax=Mycoplasma iguanae TaxID=292461 RepID=A0ABY5RAZ5_9MOLU|nr:segregation/condensation protein A [Mycoplasma iguanae]UVD81522.1 segregation/condensation protein A [Mycoplasma iguanae]
MNQNLDININNFNGPLDLLLNLIKDKKTNIFDINLVELANEYLRIINELKENNIELVAEYLLMAATLIQIKAKLILQEDQNTDPEINEDQEKILKLLAEYQQFREIAQYLRKQEEQRSLIHIKKTSDYDPYLLEQNSNQINAHSRPETFIRIMQQLFDRINARKILTMNVEHISITPKDQKKFIYQLFEKHQEITFDMILKTPSINHFVITIITLLDMAKQEEILLSQTTQFADIKIYKGQNYGL